MILPNKKICGAEIRFKDLRHWRAAQAERLLSSSPRHQPGYRPQLTEMAFSGGDTSCPCCFRPGLGRRPPDVCIPVGGPKTANSKLTVIRQLLANCRDQLRMILLAFLPKRRLLASLVLHKSLWNNNILLRAT